MFGSATSFLEEFKRLGFVLMHHVKKPHKICPAFWTWWDVLANDKVTTSRVDREKERSLSALADTVSGAWLGCLPLPLVMGL